jgi:hypothetical protein
MRLIRRIQHFIDLAKTGILGPTGNVVLSDEEKIRRMNVMADAARQHQAWTIIFHLRNVMILFTQNRSVLTVAESSIDVAFWPFRRFVMASPSKVLVELGSFRKNTNLLWWLLSSNADVFPLKKHVYYW